MKKIQLFLSRELAKIFTNLDINVEEENLKYSMDKENYMNFVKFQNLKCS